MTKGKIRRIAVIGAGVMGSGIAQVFAEHDIYVRLYSRRSSTLRGAIANIRKRQRLLVNSGLISKEKVRQAHEHLELTTSLPDAIRDVQFVNENIPEDLEEKRTLFRYLGDSLPNDVILSTNTSSFSLSSVAPVVHFPDRFLGLHWMNPAYLMPIVEVVRGPDTSTATLEIVRELTTSVGKIPIVLNEEVPGYVINRLQYALFREAVALVERSVVSVEDVDRAFTEGLGLRWAVLGPFEHMDLSGLDTVLSVSRELFGDLNSSEEAPESLTKLVAAGRLGVKTGSGFCDMSRQTLQRRARRRDKGIIEMLGARRTRRKSKSRNVR